MKSLANWQSLAVKMANLLADEYFFLCIECYISYISIYILNSVND